MIKIIFPTAEAADYAAVLQFESAAPTTCRSLQSWVKVTFSFVPASEKVTFFEAVETRLNRLV
jgi:hypothetical protein